MARTGPGAGTARGAGSEPVGANVATVDPSTIGQLTFRPPNILGATTVAEARVGGSVFVDVNQTARSTTAADASSSTLIADRALARGPNSPNSNMANAHAEIGAIQQAFNAGRTAGQDMVLAVSRPPCGFCAGDIPAMAERAGLRSLTVIYTNPTTGIVTRYPWVPGTRTLTAIQQGQ